MRRFMLRLVPVLVAVAVLGGTCRSDQAKRGWIVRGMYVGSDTISAEIWKMKKCRYDTGEAHEGRRSLVCSCTGEDEASFATQRIELNQKEPREVIISGWSKAENVSGKKDVFYAVYVDFRYADGTPLYMKTVNFETGSHDWQYGECIVKPKKPLQRASLGVYLRRHTGRAWFDDIRIAQKNPDGSWGPNLLRNGGFEAEDNVDLTARREMFETVKELNADAIHVYVGATSNWWRNPFARDDEIQDCFAGFVKDAHEHGLGVWVTLGPRMPALRTSDDPEFPFYYCVNNRFGEDWIKSVGAIARYPIDGLGMVPDEYNYTCAYAKRRYAKAADPKVKEFYEKLGAYCRCDQCVAKFKERYGTDPPDPVSFQKHDKAARAYLQFRYDSTLEWIKKSVEAAKKSRPEIRTDSLICVSPICSDVRFHSGVGWDMIGYHSGIDFLTTDPYILLHNYKGDSTHYYVSETANHLVGSNRKRQGGVVLEASKLREKSRSLEDVEIYGPPLTAIAHGAREVFYFHLNCIAGKYRWVENPKRNFEMIRRAFAVIGDISPWLEGSRKPREIAFLHSRASEDMFQIYTHDPKPGFLAHREVDTRYPFIAQKEVMYFLMRNAYSFEFYPLEQVGDEELKGFPVVLAPFPFAVSARQAAVLRRAAEAGATVMVISEVGTVDELGDRHSRPVLLDMLGLKEAPSEETDSRLSFTKDSPILPGKTPAGTFSIYSHLVPAEGARLLCREGGIVLNKLGKGRVVFLAGEFGIRLPRQPVKVYKGTSQKVPLPPLDPGCTEVMTATLEYALGGKRLLRIAKKEDQDVEAVARVNAKGDVVLFLINWDDRPARFRVGLALPAGRYTAVQRDLEGVKDFKPAGAAELDSEALSDLEVNLKAQEAKVIRIAGKD